VEIGGFLILFCRWNQSKSRRFGFDHSSFFSFKKRPVRGRRGVFLFLVVTSWVVTIILSQLAVSSDPETEDVVVFVRENFPVIELVDAKNESLSVTFFKVEAKKVARASSKKNKKKKKKKSGAA
jgi:hypothetical protein